MTYIALPDGRTLHIEITGPPSGLPVIFHHGTPGSVRRFTGFQHAVHEHGLRLVRYSRAGYGQSSRLPGRAIADVAPDISAILDHIDAPRCLVAGRSGGGPHCLATAALLPERVAGALVIAGLAPYGGADLEFLDGMGELNIELFGRALHGEPKLRPALESHARGLGANDSAAIMQEWRTLLPDVDRAVLTGEYAEDLAANYAEALHPGVDGWVDDDLAFVSPWGFSVTDIDVPTFIWHGTEDLFVPFQHGEWLARHIPGATAHLLDGEGHLSLAIGALDMMLTELAEAE
ncbi:Hydrolase [Amycolatopsis camponoti]|uniref:Hydrolase n=1 Tax=Amycolatopsis camponoti TaxID=2606593 RepID=A0A6I8LT96_9PSEU|nr:alpha/beta hydrolase [Amycolatopsis camponoti]VVJ18329.1 Hydrolase [Amycolatopsis camponoti]